MKIIFSDLDGTLLNDRHQVSPYTKSIIEQLSIPFIISSARMPRAIWPIIDELGVNMPIIAYGGGLILDHDRQTIIHQETLSPNLSLPVYKQIEELDLDIVVNVYHHDEWLVLDDANPFVVHEMMITKTHAKPINLLNYLTNHDVHKLLCIGKPKNIQTLFQLLKNRTDIQVVLSKSNYLELLPLNTSKGNALVKTCEYFDIPIKYSVAFGDHLNDLSMIKAAGIGIAMKQAPKDLQNVAALVTRTNNEDGVAYFIEHIILYERGV